MIVSRTSATMNLLVSVLLAIIIVNKNGHSYGLENSCKRHLFKEPEDFEGYYEKNGAYLHYSKTVWKNHNCAVGRHTIVHLFEWKWSDIAAECETFLGPQGYCGVQISPPNENRVVDDVNRPWWERYQPVSYKLITRSGNESQFTDMVQRCNQVDVRIYVDAVINHMTKARTEGTGTGGSQFRFYDNDINYPESYSEIKQFNGAAECPFHSDLCIHEYKNEKEVRNCRLDGLADLKQSDSVVKDRIANYMNHLISIGVAGFRVDAAKHMWPKELQDIYEKLHYLNTTFFPKSAKPFIFQEVIDMGTNDETIRASEYTDFARVTNFIYGQKLAEVFRGDHEAKSLCNWGEEWNMPKTTDVVVFIDNHDNQRGHGAGGVVLTHKDDTVRLYKMATVFMLAHHYGFTRVMSSFYFNSRDQGPPHNDDMSIKDVNSGSNTICSDGWVCEHRWRQISNMVAFRNVVNGTVVENWWDNGRNQIAFSRGNKGFIAINADYVNLDANLQTGLPEGIYCDVMSGNYEECICTGRGIYVRGDGTAYFHISSSSNEPMVAIHLGAKIGSKKKVTT